MTQSPDEPQETASEESPYREISRADLERKLAQHHKWLETNYYEGAQAKLHQRDLTNVKLNNANLQGVIFQEANLSGADLRNANLKRANLEKTNLSNADLQGANLSGAKLQGAFLEGTNLQDTIVTEADLQGANLNEANLQGADLYGASLRDASLALANLQGAILITADLSGAQLYDAYLQDANLRSATFERRVTTEGGEPGGEVKAADLIGADLRHADLSDAKLSNVMGLLADMLAGANLSNAKLPEDIAKFEGVAHVEQISKHARNNFLAVVGGCVFSWLAIAQTTDVALLTGASATPLPIIQTPVPIVGFYWAAPAILLTLYFYLHLYLQRMWEGLASLPAVFPSGRTLDRQAYPWLLSGLVSAYVPRLNDHRPSWWRFQIGLSILGAWVLVPLTLFLFWGRFLPRHDWPGTLWLSALMIIAVVMGVASYRLAAATLRGDPRRHRSAQVGDAASPWERAGRAVRSYRPERWVVVITTLTLLLSFGAIEGSPHAKLNDPRSWFPSPYWLVGYSTFAELTEADISTRPADWWKATEEQKKALEGITGANLRGQDLRYAKANGAFLAKADLRGAKLQGADLLAANLQEADLRGANLQEADLFIAKLQEADLRDANLQGAYLGRAKLQGADLVGAKLQEADLRGAKLQEADLRIAKLQEADLRGAKLQEADLRGAKLQEADLRDANLQGANLEHANLQEANLLGAKLQGANLMRANFTGTLNLTQGQLDVACGDDSTQLPDGLKIKPCPDDQVQK